MRWLLLFLLLGCGPPPPRKVAVTIPLLERAVRWITGEYVEVVTLLPPEINPFLPQEVRFPVEALRGVRPVLMIGRMDEWIVEALERQAMRPFQRFETLETPIYTGLTPCVWLSLSDARDWLDNVLRPLQKLFPEKAGEFPHNILPLKDRINELYRRVRWEYYPSHEVLVVSYSACLAYFLQNVGVRSMRLVRSPGELPKEEMLEQLRERWEVYGDKLLFVTLTVDNPEGVARVREAFPEMRSVELRTFPWEMGPEADLYDLLSWNVARLQELVPSTR